MSGSKDRMSPASKTRPEKLSLTSFGIASDDAPGSAQPSSGGTSAMAKRSSLASRRSSLNPNNLSAFPTPMVITTPVLDAVTSPDTYDSPMSAYPDDSGKTMTLSPFGGDREDARVATMTATMDTYSPRTSSVMKNMSTLRDVSGTKKKGAPGHNFPVLAANPRLPSWLARFTSLSSQAIYSELKLQFYLIDEAQGRRWDYLDNPGAYSDRTELARFAVNAAVSRANSKKNRYLNILPFDFNRVQLVSHAVSQPPLCLYPDQDYINASFIQPPCPPDVYKLKDLQYPSFIAAQGPLPETQMDFWTLLWNQNATLVVNLTREEEHGRIKCHRYWPTREEPIISSSHPHQQIGLQVQWVSEQTGLLNNTSTLYEFRLTASIDGRVDSRIVRLLQFLEWPDHAASTSTDVLQLISFSENLQGSHTAPMVVHCSAGVGRTGTFITIFSILRLLLAGALQDDRDWIRATVESLREQRLSMVQSLDQFGLCYEAVLVAMQNQYNP